jgi:hypothetical protein
MKAFFTRAGDGRLGHRFEPETFEEQLLLEMFTKHAVSEPHEFQFSSWEHNHPRAMREGLTSCWGQLIQRSGKNPSPLNTEEARPGAEHGSLPFLTDHQRYSLRCIRDFARPRLAAGAAEDQNRCDPGLSWLDDLLDGDGRSFTRGQPEKKDLSEPAVATAATGTGGLSEEQRRLLTQFQEACRVIGSHDGCAGWSALGCAIEGELTALDLGAPCESSNAATTASREWHRAELEKYLVRSDAGRGAVGTEEALRALLAARSPNQAKHEKKISTWIAVFDDALDRSVTWHATHLSLQLDGMSNVVSPTTILTLCGRAVPCQQILRTLSITPKFANREHPCESCALGETKQTAVDSKKENAIREIANDLRRTLQEAIGVARRLDEHQHFTGRIEGWCNLVQRAEKVLHGS